MNWTSDAGTPLLQMTARFDGERASVLNFRTTLVGSINVSDDMMMMMMTICCCSGGQVLRRRRNDERMDDCCSLLVCVECDFLDVPPSIGKKAFFSLLTK